MEIKQQSPSPLESKKDCSYRLKSVMTLIESLYMIHNSEMNSYCNALGCIIFLTTTCILKRVSGVFCR